MTEALQRVLVAVVTGMILSSIATGFATYYSTHTHSIELKNLERRTALLERQLEEVKRDLYRPNWGN